MRIEANAEQFLELLSQPAFCVSDGIIRAANRCAEQFGIISGEPVAPMIHSGAEDYQSYQEGHLFLSLCVNAVIHPACVSRLGEYTLFVLEHEAEDAELRAFALAAQELRIPLNQIMAICDRLFPELIAQYESEQIPDQLSRINHGLYQMLRLVGNMSDARSAGIARVEMRNITDLMDEFMEHAGTLCQSAGIRIRFDNHPAPIHSLVDAQKLERAVYNLMSNAIRFSAPDSEIHVRLALRKKTILLTVLNESSQDSRLSSSRLFGHFLREPSLFDSQSGLGLGITLARTVATAHGGALLMEQLPSGQISSTLSFPIRQDSDQLRTPVLRVDYTGERDHGLVELSEVLPAELYLPESF